MYVAVLLVVFFIAYFVTWRWRQTFSPPWLYIGIAMGVATVIILIIIFVKWRHGKSMAAGLEAGPPEPDPEPDPNADAPAGCQGCALFLPLWFRRVSRR